MRRIRNMSFVILIAGFAFFTYAASLKAFQEFCNPPAYGYGYVTVWDDGTCDTAEDPSICETACEDCFGPGNYASHLDFCDDNDDAGQWYDGVCSCGIAPR